MKRTIVLILAAVLWLAVPAAAVVRVDTLIANATATGSGGALKPQTGLRTFQAYGATSASTGAATIVIEVSNIEKPATDADWITAGTITLTLGVTRTSDGFATNAPWRNVRARISAISGTNATVSVLCSTELP